ncbi:hypothetical protein IWX78_001152 [Mycetocola sp. CAN_C7]|uniref:hypothetical protein n=1 Tax=Mycetocola sp. CAN_C7 TaxID=2787724 RepID=UPI0018CBDF6F
MKKLPLRCRLLMHKWVVMQDASDAPRYVGCKRCGRMKVLDSMGGVWGLGRNLLLDENKDRQ